MVFLIRPWLIHIDVARPGEKKTHSSYFWSSLPLWLAVPCEGSTMLSCIHENLRTSHEELQSWNGSNHPVWRPVWARFKPHLPAGFFEAVGHHIVKWYCGSKVWLAGEKGSASHTPSQQCDSHELILFLCILEHCCLVARRPKILHHQSWPSLCPESQVRCILFALVPNSLLLLVVRHLLLEAMHLFPVASCYYFFTNPVVMRSMRANSCSSGSGTSQALMAAWQVVTSPQGVASFVAIDEVKNT